MAKASYIDKCISSMQPVINTQGLVANPSAGVIMVEDKCLGYINLRLGASDEAAAKLAASVLTVELPIIGQVVHGDSVTVLGISPNEWMIITAPTEEKHWIDSLVTALGEHHSLVADVSGGTTKLNITGQHAQDVLEKGTYVDLHDSVFHANAFYATQIAHAPAMIIKNGSGDFSLIIRRSFSDHIARWAVDAAKEYGYSFV